MPNRPIMLQGFTFRPADDSGDEKMLADIREHGWHVVGVPDDEAGPGFAFSVGLYLRTLQPEILIMGLPMDLSHRVLNQIGDHLMNGGTITPGERQRGFVEGLDLLFRPVHASQMVNYLGYAIWFYRPWAGEIPVMQCVWPDPQGCFPHEPGFEGRFAARQVDLSLPLG